MSEYIPKPDLDGINSPAKDSPAKDLFILFAGFLGIVLVFAFLVSLVSDWVLSKVSIQTETRLLGKLSDQYGTYEKIPAEFQLYIDKVSTFIDFPIHVKVKCSEDMNAFAIPGGTIVITSALLAKIKTENGLTALVGHEIGHFINRDHMRGFSRQIILGTGATILGFGQVSGFSYFWNLISLNYSRSQEVAADDYGIQLMKKMYGHSWGAEELFTVLKEEEKAIEKFISKFSSTHPLGEDRIQRIRTTQTGQPQLPTVPETPYSEWVRQLNCGK